MTHAANEALLLEPAALPGRRRGIGTPKTWHLFVLLSVTTGLLNWVTNEHIMTREVFHNLLGSQMEADRIDASFDTIRQSSVWGVYLAPLVVWLRIAMVACMAQLVLLLLVVEVPIARLFRATAWAHGALLYGAAMRLVWLARQENSTLTRADLSYVPGSVNALLPDLFAGSPALYALMSMVNLWEVVWCAALFVGLRRSGGLQAGTAGLAVGTVWTLATLFQWLLAVYLAGVS